MAPKKRNFGSPRPLKSGRWQARYTPPGGGKMENAPDTFATRREADRWLARREAELTLGLWRHPSTGSESLLDYVHAWLVMDHNLRASTRALDTSLTERFIMRAGADLGSGRGVALGDQQLSQITPLVVRRWHSWVVATSRAGALAKKAPAAEGSTRWNRALRAWAEAQGISVKPTGRVPASVRQHWERAGRPALLPPPKISGREGSAQAAQAYRLLHAILEQAVADGLIASNPCQIKGASTAKAPERTPATPEEVAAIAAAAPPRYQAAVLIAAWGGLRAGEVFALDRRAVDVEAGFVVVERTLLSVQGKLSFGPPKSDAGYRKVYLPAHVCEAVQRHMNEFTAPGPDALLFTTSTGGPLASSGRTVWFRRAAASAGRDDLRFHDLRHTGATLAAQTGATLADLQRRFGHTTVAAAMRYQHSSEAADREIAKRLGPMTVAS
ncbi:site-specific recombinase XerD [Terracoccus luteus]|uniref:Site-specific recombinase XerD n=1 Tax=Terracoccus luteus TaxID=53356 RepID=A0A495Y0S7_9MICO|nr:tyrosine-type recombinase/integrase [Terracoccus luteus]RKT79209.1 site-specific recombinase XerD [Terracoccus luteus]